MYIYDLYNEYSRYLRPTYKYHLTYTFKVHSYLKFKIYDYFRKCGVSKTNLYLFTMA